MHFWRSLVILWWAIAFVAGSAAPAQTQDTFRTFAIWQSDGFFYPGEVEREEGDLAFVRFADGDSAWVPKWGVTRFDLQVGEEVFANWKGGGRYYPGTVAERDGDEIRINYRDGDVENSTISRVRMKLGKTLMQVGMPVMGRWAPDGFWYPGVIKQARDGWFLVAFGNGDSAWLERKHLVNYRPTLDDRIQGNWKGGGRYYAGTVLQRRGEQLYVRYDDGDEEWTTISRVRADYGLTTPTVIP